MAGRQVVIPSCEDVFRPFSVSNHLSIALDFHRGRLAGAVEDGECRPALVLAGDDVDACIGDELGHRTFDNHVVTLSPVQQSTGPSEHVLLRLVRPSFVKALRLSPGKPPVKSLRTLPSVTSLVPFIRISVP